MNQITTVGVDLAKEVIVVCGADTAGRVVLRKQLSCFTDIVQLRRFVSRRGSNFTDVII